LRYLKTQPEERQHGVRLLRIKNGLLRFEGGLPWFDSASTPPQALSQLFWPGIIRHA
jgi:hypothetical protein